MASDFWKDKRVLVTGHTGFEGAWLCLWLRHLGAVVAGLSPKTYDTPNLWNLLALEDIHHYEGDVSDTMAIEDVLARENPEIVFHLAGVGASAHASSQPVETFKSTVVAPVALLDAVSRSPRVRACVFVSSDRCLQQGLMKSGDPNYASDPFAVALATSEAAVVSTHQTLFPAPEPGLQSCAIAIARAGNVIGGGDWTEGRLVPDIVRGCFGPDQSVLIQTPNEIRSWQHVLDPLRGYLMLAEHLAETSPKDAQAWDFFPERDTEVTALSVADAMIANLGCGYVEFDQKTHDAPIPEICAPDLNKSAQLGWAPTVGFEQAIELTGAWYKDWRADQSPLELCTKQLSVYLAQCELHAPQENRVSA